MKKKYICTGIIFILSLCSWFSYKKIESRCAQHVLSDCAVRFHVKANSDSETDQNIKMKVKNAVVDYICQNTRNFDTVEETKIFVTRNDSTIREIAGRVIRDNGYDYPVTSYFGKQDFPEKAYGDVTFPAGNYTSYTLYLGKGRGHNWWCVLYPPLCFTDASTGTLPDSSKQMLRESLTEKEYDSVVRYRFKYFTFLNQFL